MTASIRRGVTVDDTVFLAFAAALVRLREAVPMIPDLIPRARWEEPGWTVDEHTSSGPHPYSRTTAVIVHYTAASSTPETEASVRDYIRRTQRDYAANRGYSIGYNWVVDRQGRVWEARGDGYKCAANGNSTTNDNPAVLCLVNGADPANEPMIAAVRDVVAHVEDMTGRTIHIKGHRDVRATACPGDGLYAQVLDGTFRPTPEPPPKDDDVYKFLQIDGFQDQFLILPVSGETKRRMGAVGQTPIRVSSTQSRQQLEQFLGYELTPE